MKIEQSSDPTVNKIVRSCFPNNRKPVKIEQFRGPRNVNSYWSDGSKDVYHIYDLSQDKTYSVPTSHPFFDRKCDETPCGNIEINELPPNCVLVQGGTFMGKPASVTIYFREDNMVPLIADKSPLENLPPESIQALNIIGSTKGGAYRREEFSRFGLGIYGADNRHIVPLLNEGLLTANKAGAISITLKGQNLRR